MSITVGCIGLGNMGKPMARNVLQNGFAAIGFDIVKANLRELSVHGLQEGESVCEVCRRADVLLLSLPSLPVLRSVMDDVLSADLGGKILIDTTTATLQAAQELATAVAARGGAFLDSPVTGGIGGAESGKLSIMIGGEREAFDRALPVYQAIGENIVYVGDSGHGQIAKMVNQLMMGAIYCSVAEAFGFAAQHGVDVEKVYQAVEQGGAKSAVLSSMKKRILSGEYGGGHYLAQHGKDIDYVMDEANRSHSYMPVTSAVHEVWNLARAMGLSSLDSGSMFAVWEQLLNRKLNSTIRGEGSDAV